jgi:hypothetical protein
MRAGRQALGCQPRRPLLPAADLIVADPYTHAAQVGTSFSALRIGRI